jgi:hypothetical protein
LLEGVRNDVTIVVGRRSGPCHRCESTRSPCRARQCDVNGS